MDSAARTIQATGKQGLDLVMQWIRFEMDRGALAFVAEGLPGSGKSTLVKYTTAAKMAAYDLDTLLGKDVPNDQRWTDRVIRRGALRVFNELIRSTRPFLFAGASAFEVLDRHPIEIDHDAIRRIYLKEMSWRGDRAIWFQGEFDAHEQHDPNTYMGSIRHYHANSKPWLRANLIFERLPDEKPD